MVLVAFGKRIDMSILVLVHLWPCPLVALCTSSAINKNKCSLSVCGESEVIIIRAYGTREHFGHTGRIHTISKTGFIFCVTSHKGTRAHGTREHPMDTRSMHMADKKWHQSSSVYHYIVKGAQLNT